MVFNVNKVTPSKINFSQLSRSFSDPRNNVKPDPKPKSPSKTEIYDYSYGKELNPLRVHGGTPAFTAPLTTKDRRTEMPKIHSPPTRGVKMADSLGIKDSINLKVTRKNAGFDNLYKNMESQKNYFATKNKGYDPVAAYNQKQINREAAHITRKPSTHTLAKELEKMTALYQETKDPNIRRQVLQLQQDLRYSTRFK